MVAPGDGSKARKVLVTTPKSTTNRPRCSHVSRSARPAVPASRGLLARSSGILLGTAMAGAGIVAMQATVDA